MTDGKSDGPILIRKLTPQDAGEYQQIRLRAVEEHPEAFVPVPEEERKKTLDEVTKRFATLWNKDNNFIHHRKSVEVTLASCVTLSS